MYIGKSIVNLFIIILFLLFVNSLAFIQLTFVIKIPIQFHHFIIPTILASIFAIIIIMFRRNAHFGKMIKYDYLTGAHSRYASELLFETEMKRYKRGKQEFSIILYDIDDFKIINDTYGHLVGDKILKELTKDIHDELRDMDTLFRWGGEEFIVLMPNTDKTNSYEIAKRLKDKVQNSDFGLEQPVTISIGVTTVLEEDQDLGKIILRSDRAMYKAKELGKNRIEVV